MKRFLISILITVSVVALLPKRILKACVDFLDPDHYHVTFFSPAIQTEKGNYPFYLSYHALNGVQPGYTDEDDEKKGVNTPGDTNLGEWQNYFGGKASKEDIRQVVYKLSYKGLYNITSTGKIPDSLKGNTCLKLLVGNKGNSNVVNYLLYAKMCEPVVSYRPDWWDDNPKPKDYKKMAILLAEGMPMYKKEANDFIKLRYAYQLVRLAGYSGDDDKCLKLYDLYVASSKAKSTISNWALLIKAVALLDVGKAQVNESKKVDGIYNLVQVFDKCPEKKVVAFQYFKNSADQKVLEDVMKECKTDHERAVVMAMSATTQYGAYPIGLSDVYKYDPNLPELENLIVREINKQEQNVLMYQLFASSKYPYISGVGIGNYGLDETPTKPKENRLGDLSSILDKFIADGKMNNKGFLYLAKAYVQLLQANTDGCKKTLADATAYCKGNDKLEDELHFLNILCRINSEKKLKPSVEESIYPDLQWIAGDNHPVVNYEYYANVMRVLAMKYIAQDDFARAVACLSKSAKVDKSQSIASYGEAYAMLSKSGTHDNLKEVYELLTKKNKTDYEKFITDGFQFDENRILDFQGTLYLREHNFEKAADLFSKIGNEYWQQDKFKTFMAANPFNTEILDTHAKTKGDTAIYNKYTFSKKMEELGKKKDAQSLYLYATGLYNMDYYGNSWLTVMDAWSSSDADMYTDTAMKKYGPFPQNTPFTEEYFKCVLAKKYYQEAMDASKDDEFKAQCCFMAAKCEQKEFDLYDSVWASHHANYFEMMRTKFNQTKFYQTATGNCSLLSSYIKNMH